MARPLRIEIPGDRRIREATLTTSYTLNEIGRHLGLHYSTVSHIRARG